MNDSGGVLALIDALNDRTRTRIGNPWNRVYHVAIDVTDREDVHQILAGLAELDVTAKLNLGTRDRIGIYQYESIKRLLETLEARLVPSTQTQLERLVLARGPVPNVTRWFIHDQRAMGWTDEEIAAELNRKPALRDMGGGGWTVAKIRKAARLRGEQTTQEAA